MTRTGEPTDGVSAVGTAGLRVAVIGVGRMGIRHVQAVKRLGMIVCGVADQSESALKAISEANQIHANDCFTDAHSLLKTAKPEAVVVATTAPSHATLVLAAAAAGARYILCEKPMAVSLAEADAMIATCHDAGTQLAVNHQMRFMPQYTRVKALIGSEELGPLSSILVAGSNFGLAMNASHYFEMFCYISGAPVSAVRAWFDDAQVPNPRGSQFEDRAGRLLALSEAGSTMYMDFSATAGYGLQVTYICRFGQIVVDELNGDVRIASRKAEFRHLPTTRYAMPAEMRSFAIEPADTVAPTMAVWAAMLAGGSFPDGTTGAHSLACLVAAHVSDEAGGLEIPLDSPALPRTRVFNWA